MNYQEFKELVIKYATESQITDYELYYSKSDDTGAEIYKDEVKGFNSSSSMGVCFRCIVNGQVGYASTEHLSEEEASSIVKRAIENANSLESEIPSFIHSQGDSYLSYEPTPHTAPTAAELIDFALELQQEVYKADARVIDGTQTQVGSGVSERAIFNSNGLDLMDHASYDFCYSVALVSDGNEMYDGMEIASGDISTFDKHDIAQKAVEDALAYIGYTTVDSGEYDIVFSNKVMASLLGTYSSIFSAEAAQKGLSLFKDKLGQEVASSIVTLTDDPLHKDALVKATFDDEGAATYAKNVIENGKLTTFLHNLATAKKAGVKTTGNGYKASYAASMGINYFSFYINPIKGTKEDLFQEMLDGLYITSVEGMHSGADPISGDFSLSSTGFLVKDGKKSTPVKGITISGNFVTLLKSITSIGEDLQFSPYSISAHRCGSPSVLAKNISVAGK